MKCPDIDESVHTANCEAISRWSFKNIVDVACAICLWGRMYGSEFGVEIKAIRNVVDQVVIDANEELALARTLDASRAEYVGRADARLSSYSPNES